MKAIAAADGFLDDGIEHFDILCIGEEVKVGIFDTVSVKHFCGGKCICYPDSVIAYTGLVAEAVTVNLIDVSRDHLTAGVCYRSLCILRIVNRVDNGYYRMRARFFEPGYHLISLRRGVECNGAKCNVCLMHTEVSENSCALCSVKNLTDYSVFCILTDEVRICFRVVKPEILRLFGKVSDDLGVRHFGVERIVCTGKALGDIGFPDVADNFSVVVSAVGVRI